MPLSPWAQQTHPLPLACLPEPYHRLLAHPSVLTPHLEAYYRERVHLLTVTSRIEADWLTRKVMLSLESAARVVEFGAIRVALARLPSPLREAVLAGKQAFGSLLQRFGFAHQTGKRIFFTVAAKELIIPANIIRPQGPLYGRTHDILTTKGEPLAYSSEILTGLYPCRIQEKERE